MKIYLDNCCFNRPFDDQSQLRIKLETEAKLRIQEEVCTGNLELAWSYILDYENGKNSYEDRKERMKGWKKYAVTDIQENTEILKKTDYLNSIGLKKMDSLHVACAIISR